MLNKDKRSLMLCLVIGDGCLHYIRNNGKVYGGITIQHGLEQSDYISWKAQMLSALTGKNVKVRTAQKGTAVQCSLCWKRLRAWRKFCYPNGKKDRARIFRFIRHPEMALAIWLADDGYNETSAQLRLFSCGSKDQAPIVEWLKQFNVAPRVKTQHVKWIGKDYEYVKFTVEDSLKLWALCRDFLLQFRSMRHKFRYIEHKYQQRVLQRTPPNGDDIVSTGRNI